MEDDFYEFNHKCESMPWEMDGICKIKGSSSSQATFCKYMEGVGRFELTLYGLKFCPYCGTRVERDV